MILAAGAIGSPQILQLSGIGPGAVLQPLGIEVKHALAGVGENLQDHLQIRCAYKVAGVKTMNERFQSLVQRAGFAAQYALTRRGPMTMAPSQLGAFVKSDPSRETPNLQYHIQPLTLAQVRRAARSVPGLHGQRRQYPPDQPRLGAHHGTRPVGASRDPAQLSGHRRRPARGCRYPCA